MATDTAGLIPAPIDNYQTNKQPHDLDLYQPSKGPRLSKIQLPSISAAIQAPKSPPAIQAPSLSAAIQSPRSYPAIQAQLLSTAIQAPRSSAIRLPSLSKTTLLPSMSAIAGRSKDARNGAWHESECFERWWSSDGLRQWTIYSERTRVLGLI